MSLTDRTLGVPLRYDSLFPGILGMTRIELRKYALAAWVLLLCLASQIPYYMVWTGSATFPYDAYTVFSYWNIARLEAVRDGTGLLGFFHTGIPSEVWPSLYFSGFVRQLAALFQANTAWAHAMVQAFHALLLTPAVALLFRSFGVPMRFGVIGGLLYSLAGIHVSLSQHVYAHEALLYLVLSLWGVRELLLGWNSRTPRVNLAVLLLSGITLVSLVRVHHEAILYVVPLFLWTVFHLWTVYARDGSKKTLDAVARLALIGLFVALCSVPMLLTAYDISLTNKTQPYAYSDLQPYFHDFRTFLLALVLPGFAGKVDVGYPFPYTFGQDSTLSYIFLGSLSLALFGVTVLSKARQRRWLAAIVLVVCAVALTAYTYGPDNVIHRAISGLFPFLVRIGHGYYGLHLLYLVAAFGVAEGIRQLAEGNGLRTFALLQVAVLAAVLYLALRAHIQGGWGVDGSLAEFGAVLQMDTRWLANITSAALAIVGCALTLRRFAKSPEQARRTSSALIVAGLGGLVAVDVIRPTINAHFVPGEGSSLVQSDPIGGFNLSTEVVEYFRKTTAGLEKPTRVLPLFQKPGGWRPNALLPLKIQLVHAPADSGGNLNVSQLLAKTPSEAVIADFIDQFGVDVFWVARWGMDDWQAVLAASPRLTKVFRSEYGGDVYAVRKDHAFPATGSGASGFRWNAGKVTVEDGLVTRRWTFDRPRGGGNDPNDPVSLPLLWHAGYGVRLGDGTQLRYSADRHGRVSVIGAPRGPDRIIVEYPNRPLSVLVALSALAYLAAVALLLAVAIRALAETRRRKRPSSTSDDSLENR